MAVRNTFFIAGYGSLQSSYQGDHQEIAGYGPLQRSHQGDHNEISGYGPFQSSHQGYRVLIDQWEAGTWSCDLRANERPWKKFKTDMDIATTRPNQPSWPIRWKSLSIILLVPGSWFFATLNLATFITLKAGTSKRSGVSAVTCWLPLGYCRNLSEFVPVKGGIISSSLSLIEGNWILPITPREGCDWALARGSQNIVLTHKFGDHVILSFSIFLQI